VAIPQCTPCRIDRAQPSTGTTGPLTGSSTRTETFVVEESEPVACPCSQRRHATNPFVSSQDGLAAAWPRRASVPLSDPWRGSAAAFGLAAWTRHLSRNAVFPPCASSIGRSAVSSGPMASFDGGPDQTWRRGLCMFDAKHRLVRGQQAHFAPLFSVSQDQSSRVGMTVSEFLDEIVRLSAIFPWNAPRSCTQTRR